MKIRYDELMNKFGGIMPDGYEFSEHFEIVDPLAILYSDGKAKVLEIVEYTDQLIRETIASNKQLQAYSNGLVIECDGRGGFCISTLEVTIRGRYGISAMIDYRDEEISYYNLSKVGSLYLLSDYSDINSYTIVDDMSGTYLGFYNNGESITISDSIIDSNSEEYLNVKKLVNYIDHTMNGVVMSSDLHLRNLYMEVQNDYSKGIQ